MNQIVTTEVEQANGHRRSTSLIVRALLFGMFMTMVSFTPTNATHSSTFGQPSYTGNDTGESYTVTMYVPDGPGSTVTLTASPISGPNGGQPTGVPETEVTDSSNTVTFTVNSLNAGTSTLTAVVTNPEGNTIATHTTTATWAFCPTGAPTFSSDIVRDIVMYNECDGFVLDGLGGVHPLGEAGLVTGLPYFNFDIARELVLTGSSDAPTGGFILDGWGGAHPFATAGGSQPAPLVGLPYFAGNDIARDLILGPLYTSGYLLDGYGGMHPFGGNAAKTGLPSFSFDIAREVVSLDGTASGYMLDGYGGMHPFGGSGALTGLPYFSGNDVANDALLTGGESGYVLDAYGGIHPFGYAPTVDFGGPYTPGVDTYKAFDLGVPKKGVVVTRFGNLFEFFTE